MRRKIEKILIAHNKGNITTNVAINKILSLSVIDKKKIEICPVCNKHILINDVCPQCTIDFCTPFDGVLRF
jgi:hypothetical protein